MVALVVLWRLRYKLSLRDLPEMFAPRGMVFSHEAVREWEAKLTPALAEELRRRRCGKAGRSWYVDETDLKVAGRWCHVCRATDKSGALQVTTDGHDVYNPATTPARVARVLSTARGLPRALKDTAF